MKRLDDKSDDKADYKIGKIIKKLELLIIQDEVTQSKLNSLQKTLDNLDDELEEPNYRLYELQSIIYYAENNKTKAMEFIGDALSLQSDVTNYSKTGALLAEIYVESKNISKSEDDNSLLNEGEDEFIEKSEKDKVNEEEIKELRKKYSGKFEGWLALYTLRIVFIPFVFIFDIISSHSEFSGLESVPSSVERYLLFVTLFEGSAVVLSLAIWFMYFKKKKSTIVYARILEISLVVLYFIAGLWSQFIFRELDVSSNGEDVRLMVYGFVAFIWVFYWMWSKRVIATFIKD
jgi:hypothetical protein